MPAHPCRLSVQDLAVERGGRLVLSGLSFSAAAQTALVVTGPNGAGKSTLLRTIAGLLHPLTGTIDFDGGDPELTTPEQCHYFGHQDGLKSALTVRENARFWQEFYWRGASATPGRASDTIVEALAGVGLDHLMDLPAAYLSAGQRRRLAFARLLASHRPIWLLDEPTAAMDAGSEHRLTGCVNSHLAAGGIVIAATHAPLAFQAQARLDLGHLPGEASA